VIDAMSEYLRRSNTNLGGAFPASEESDRLVRDAHVAAADLVGADPGEIVFGPNATTLLFAVSRAIGRTLGPGDEVVVTRLDHDANVRPWIRVAWDAGATVRWVDVRPFDSTLDLESFRRVLTDRTRVVAFTLASNAVGTIPPAAELVAVAKEAGAIVALDGVHLAQHRALDLRGLGADLLACSPYKVFGPHIGMLAVRRELLDDLDPYRVRPTDPYPGGLRWETGTQNHEGLAGFVAAVEYMTSLGQLVGSPGDAHRRASILAAYEAIRRHEESLGVRFLEGLSRINRVELVGIGDPDRISERTPTFAIRVREQSPRDVAEALATKGIYVWDGHYYAIELFERLGLLEEGGAVRIGFCHYHTPQEVDRVLEGLTDL
jgi:cysteine desulfurase family protein (TIGR01976 family)